MYQHTIQVDPSAYHHISVSAISQQHQSSMHPVSSHCLSLSNSYIIGKNTRSVVQGGTTWPGRAYGVGPSVSAMVYHHPDSLVHRRMLVRVRLCRLGRLCFYHIELSRPSHSFDRRPTLCTPSSPSRLTRCARRLPPRYSNPLLFYLILHVYCTPYTLPLTPFPFILRIAFIYCTLSTPSLFIVLTIVNVAISLDSSHPPLHPDGLVLPVPRASRTLHHLWIAISLHITISEYPLVLSSGGVVGS